MKNKSTENEQNKSQEKPEIRHPDTPHTVIPNKADEGYAIGEKQHHTYQKPGEPETHDTNKNPQKNSSNDNEQNEPNMSNKRDTWNQKESDNRNFSK